MQPVILAEIDTALGQQDIRQAEVIIARALRSTFLPLERAELLLRRAQARLSDARPDDALDDLENCQELNPHLGESPEIQTLHGDIYFARFELATVGFAQRSDTEQALKIYQQIIQKHPKFKRIGWVYYQMGRIFLTQNLVLAAKEAFESARQALCYPDHLHAVTEERLGFIALFEERQPQIALRHFEEARQLAPKEMNPIWRLQLQRQICRMNLKLGQAELAAEAVHRVVRDAENSLAQRAILPEAYLMAAEIIAHIRGLEEDAIEFYGRYLQISPHPVGIDVTWSSVHEQVGYLSLRLKKYPQAISSFTKSLEFNPYHPWETKLYYHIGHCHYALGAYDRALGVIKSILQKAELETIPITNWQLYNLLGNSYFALGQYEAAHDAYQRALELAPPHMQGVETTRSYLQRAKGLSQSKE